MSNDPNLSRTAAIDVLFFINLAVVFDFIYFRFRPSKAKLICNVLRNRRNAANYLVFLFLINFIAASLGDFKSKSLVFIWYSPTPSLTGECFHPHGMYIVQVYCGWIAASILKTKCYCQRHYIDALMHLAPVGKAQQYCSVFNFQLVFRGLFLQFAAHCLRTQTVSVRQ